MRGSLGHAYRGFVAFLDNCGVGWSGNALKRRSRAPGSRLVVTRKFPSDATAEHLTNHLGDLVDVGDLPVFKVEAERAELMNQFYRFYEAAWGTESLGDLRAHLEACAKAAHTELIARNPSLAGPPNSFLALASPSADADGIAARPATRAVTQGRRLAGGQ